MPLTSLSSHLANEHFTYTSAKLLLRHGVPSIVSLVSPYAENRENAREIINAGDQFAEVYNFLIHKKAPTGLEEKKQLLSKQKKFPDLNNDGKVTYADVLKGRGVDLKKKLKKD